jgi:transcriptional regulator with XRE-family HTH domain
MAKTFSTLREAMSPAAQKRVKSRTRSMLREIRLQELRQTRQVSQEALASVLGSTQAGVSKLERRNDLYLSSLREYIEALGGTLELRARFPDGEFALQNLGELSDATRVVAQKQSNRTTATSGRPTTKSKRK